ncbi:MAG: hypothetical protein QM751_06245 [Paludibacteraceae bacterium]
MWTKIITFFFGAKAVNEDWVKWLKYGLLIFLLFRVRVIYSWIKLQFDKNVVGKSDNPISNGGYLTDNYIRLLASKLLNAMSGFGTDEDAVDSVYNVMLIYPAGLYDLYSSFGTPKYFAFGSNEFLGTPTDLRGWLAKEISTSDYLKWDTLLTSEGL